MATRTFISLLCFLVVFTGAAAGPIEHHAIWPTDGGDILRSKPKISVIDLSGPNTIPRQRNFDKQFYSPHSLPDLLKSSNVLDSSPDAFGQETKPTNSAKTKHTFYIATPTANLKRDSTRKESNTSILRKTPTVPAISLTGSGHNNDNSDNKHDESFVIKRDSNRFDAPAALSSTEDVLTDAGLLSSFGSSLFSNDALSSQSPTGAHSFGIPLPSSPPINSEPSLFTAGPANSATTQDILSLTQNLSPQDVTAFTNSLSPEEVTSLTKNLLKSFNIESKDLDDLLNLNGNLLGSSGGSSGQSQQFGIPLPNINSIDSFESASRSRASGSSVPRTNSHSFGIPLPGTGSHSPADNIGKELSSGTSFSSGNSESSIGIPLPEFGSHSSSDNIGSSISSEKSESFPLPGFDSDSASFNSFSQSQSIGIPLPGQGSDFSTGNVDPNTIFATPTSSNNLRTSDQSNSFGIPHHDLNSNTFSVSFGTQANSEQTLSAGIPLPTFKDESSQSVGIPLSEVQAASSLSTDFPVTGLNDISHAVGIPLPQFESGSSQSVGIPLPELKSDVSAFGIPPLSLTSVSSSDGLGQTQTFGVPLPSFNQAPTSGRLDSLSEASGQSHSLGIPLPGLNYGAVSDGLNNVKSVGISLPGINPDDSGSNFFTPLTVVSEGNTQFSLNKDGNNNILSSSSSAKLSPVFIGTSDDDKKTVTVDVNVNTKSDPLDSLTIGQLLMGMNGQNGIVVLPMSSLNDAKKSKANGLTVVTDSSAESDEKIVVNLSNSAITTSAPATTTRRARRTTTTTKAPDKFRVTLSDLLYSKGQWFGTLFGGIIDYGKIAWNTVQDHINSQPQPGYGPTYGSYTYGG